MTSVSVVTVATPTPSFPVKNASALYPLLEDIREHVSEASALALYQYLVDAKAVLHMNVKVIGMPLDRPAWSSAPLIFRAAGANFSSWDGKTLQTRDAGSAVIVTTSPAAGAGAGAGVAAVAVSSPSYFVKTENSTFAGLSSWLLTFAPAAGNTFQVTAPTFQLVLRAPATATLLALLMDSPTVFEETSELEVMS